MEKTQKDESERLGLLIVESGITDDQIGQLINYANSDHEVILYTSDPTRFKDRQAFDRWREKGRVIYVMTDKLEGGDLLGIVWFGKDDLPDKVYKNLSDSERGYYGFTFAIRIYDRARGLRLAQKFMASVFESFRRTSLWQESVNNGVWLETSEDNLPAVSAYRQFGFEQVSEPDNNRKIIMVYKPKAESGL